MVLFSILSSVLEFSGAFVHCTFGDHCNSEQIKGESSLNQAPSLFIFRYSDPILFLWVYRRILKDYLLVHYASEYIFPSRILIRVFVIILSQGSTNSLSSTSPPYQSPEYNSHCCG